MLFYKVRVKDKRNGTWILAESSGHSRPENHDGNDDLTVGKTLESHLSRSFMYIMHPCYVCVSICVYIRIFVCIHVYVCRHVDIDKDIDSSQI